MIGDVRGVTQVGAVYLSLVFRADAGVGEAGEGDVIVPVLIGIGGPDGGTEDRGEEVQVGIVFRHFEGQEDGGLDDGNPFGISALFQNGLKGLFL